MSKGLKRAVVYPETESIDYSPRFAESLLAFTLLQENDLWAIGMLGIGTTDQFRLSEKSLAARAEMLKKSKVGVHRQDRGMHELGKLVCGKIDDIEAEFYRRQTLDIGCGLGILDAELARKARSRMFMVDNDAEVLSTIPRRVGKTILASGQELPIRSDSFDRTVVSFSSLTWAKTPRETASALNEALRVTAVGGCLIAVPIMSNVQARRDQFLDYDICRLGGRARHRYLEDEGGMKVWALQDHLIFNALISLSDRGQTSITWNHHTAIGIYSGEPLEHFSAIIDKHRPIPQEFFDANLNYAASFDPQD